MLPVPSLPDPEVRALRDELAALERERERLDREAESLVDLRHYNDRRRAFCVRLDAYLALET